MFHKSFYPTPKNLISKMVRKIQGTPVKILEPEGGKGDIIDFMLEDYKARRFCTKDRIFTIEIDENLQAILKGKGYKVLDADFLTFTGPDKFDLIIGNPPFDEGDKHLLKAIEILYRGQIIFLLNAETLKNPYSNARKQLTRKLKELNAEIEYIQNAFAHAERSTHVEVALVNIVVERKVEEDLFKDATDKAETPDIKIEEKYELTTGKHVQELVAEYGQIVDIGTKTIVGYYQNYRKIGGYIGINKEARSDYSKGNLTEKMQSTLNDFLIDVRKSFWRKTLDLKEVRTRMTNNRVKEFNTAISQQCDMDFTEHNIRAFVLSLINGYEQIIMNSILELFDRFTIENAYHENLCTENIHYFTGWKTNNAFKVRECVVIPIRSRFYSSEIFWNNWAGKWKAGLGLEESVRDIDTVMTYFGGMNNDDTTIYDACKTSLDKQVSRGILSTYFKVSCYKKGTMHLTFRSKDILRRFNIAACIGKNFIPYDYSKKPYESMNDKEKEVVNAFEGKESYEKHLNQPLFPESTRRLRLAV